MKWYSEFLKTHCHLKFSLSNYLYISFYLSLHLSVSYRSFSINCRLFHQSINLYYFIYLSSYIHLPFSYFFLFLSETAPGYILRHKQMAAEHALDTHHGPVSCSYSLTSCNKVLHRPSASICNVAQTWSRHDPFCRLKNWMIDSDKGFSLAWMCSLGEI